MTKDWIPKYISSSCSSIPDKQSSQKVGRSKHISPKKTYTKLINTWKDVQHHSLLEKCKSKLQWYHLLPVRRAIIKKSTNNKSCKGYGEKGTLLNCWCECKLIQPLWRTVWIFLKKLGILPIPIQTTIWSNKLTTGHIAWRNQNWKRYMYPSVHDSTIYNS